MWVTWFLVTPVVSCIALQGNILCVLAAPAAHLWLISWFLHISTLWFSLHFCVWLLLN
jgi:hypothetical protein